jgi:hypothetical protein
MKTDVPMLEFARVARLQLGLVPAHLWALWFVELRMSFARLYSKGICSTTHGVDFFDNVLAGPDAWKEEGEYGDNFRKLFK